MIVFTVLDHACTGDNFELTAADTDLLIMLIYFWKFHGADNHED